MNTVNRDYPYNREQPLEVEWQAPGQNNTGNTQWNGSTYRGTYQNHNQHSGGSGEPPKQKPPKKPVKLWVKIVCGAAACLVISAGSIGGFIGLVNMGAIPFATPRWNISNSIVNTTKVEKDNTNETSTITGKLTTEEVAQKVIPSVVCIYQAYSNTNGYFGTSSESGEGSGIIASSDGYIITNAHVIEGASALKVILSNGTSYEAKIVGSDTATDLALIKIDATDLQAAEFGSSEDLQVGEQVIAIGNPGGIQFNSSVTVGYVSAVNRSITYNGYDMECIQTDAAIDKICGGALVNIYGQIIGINSAKITATGYEGLGFAIPIDTAQPIINNLKQYGYVKDRAMLGITGRI